MFTDSEVHTQKLTLCRLQILLTKLRRFASDTAQIICISATIGGLDATIHWLDASFFCTNYRPVQLREHVAFGPHVHGLETPAPRNPALASGQNPTSSALQSSNCSATALAGQVPADIIEAVATANLTFQRTIPVDSAAKTPVIADQVVLSLALEAGKVRGATPWHSWRT